MSPSGWREIESRMREGKVADLPIRIFRTHYEHVAAGEQSIVRDHDIQSIDQVDDLDQLPAEIEQRGQQLVPETAILKLNGGLGTGMGLAGPKSLLPLREGYTFLDLIVAQTRSLEVPLWLMNSFATDTATREALARIEAGDQVGSFLQHRVPKLLASDLSPATWEPQPELAWCPPGHGDLYAALVTSGTLERMLSDGIFYLFVSNADNLGATLDPRVLGYMVAGGHSFLMEVADRTLADRKGGHLARRPDGTLLLRESAQCHPDDRETFQDIERHRYFNTNNLWLDLRSLADELDQRDNQLPLSLIVNRKRVDPVDSDSPEVLQLETAMGSAISVMPNAAALRVPRSRFAPVKTTGDLLTVRSDAYRLDDDFAVRLIAQRDGHPPIVKLDERYYRAIDDLDGHIRIVPSLKECERLTIDGEFEIAEPTTMFGEVTLRNSGPGSARLPGGEYRGEIVK